MRENFPLTRLLTSRSVNHGLSKAREHNTKDPACQSLIVNYFKTGFVGFTDGIVCEATSNNDIANCCFSHLQVNLYYVASDRVIRLKIAVPSLRLLPVAGASLMHNSNLGLEAKLRLSLMRSHVV